MTANQDFKLPTAPKLSQLKTEDLTKEQLQAALVQLIELHNQLTADLNRLIASGAIKRPNVMDMTFNL